MPAAINFIPFQAFGPGGRIGPGPVAPEEPSGEPQGEKSEQGEG